MCKAERRKTKNRQEGIWVAHFDASEKLSACIGLRNACVSNSKFSVQLDLFLFPSSNTLRLVDLFLFQFLCLEKVEHPDEKWERERKIPPLHLPLIWNPVNCSHWKNTPETKRGVRRGERQLKTERECTSGNQLYTGRRHGSLGSVTWHPKRKEQERRKREGERRRDE